MTGCLKCGDTVSTEEEIAESLAGAERIARKFPPIPFLGLDVGGGLIDRATKRAELERAGLCTYHAVLLRDNARDGEKGAN